jgi:UPF0271 protein
MKNQAILPSRRVVILDTSAFVAGFDSFSLCAEQVTVPKVEKEIRRDSVVKMRLEAAIESGKLKVKSPKQEFSNSAKATASKIGDSFKLSEADLQLLGLALELKTEGYTPQIVTDDYSIQNVSTQLGIEFVTLATFGIKRLLKWIRYCPACYREYPTNDETKECQVCGTELKRKPRRSKKIEQ